MGLTFLAAGTSVPDLLSSVIVSTHTTQHTRNTTHTTTHNTTTHYTLQDRTYSTSLLVSHFPGSRTLFTTKRMLLLPLIVWSSVFWCVCGFFFVFKTNQNKQKKIQSNNNNKKIHKTTKNKTKQNTHTKKKKTKVLMMMILAVVCVIHINKWVMTKALGYTMFLLYVVFVAQVCSVV